MATVSNTIQLRDRMTPVLRSIIRAMRSTADVLSEVDGISNRNFNRMRNDIAAAEDALGDFVRQVPDAEEPVNRVTQGFSGWQRAIVVANQALQLVQQGAQKIGDVLNRASSMTDQQSRLKLITDEQTDIYQLQEMIAASAMSTRSSYESTADSVISMYRSLSGYGATLAQSVRLSEILNKQLGAAGVKGAAQESVMYNLNQSLAAGVLRWEDWKIISSNAGGMVANLAKTAGVTSAEFNKMVQDGEITAARFAELLWQTAEGAEGIDAVFEEMPDTFADWMTNIQTFASGEFLSEGGLGDKLNELFASEGWIETVNQIKGILASLFSWLSIQVTKVTNMLQSSGFQSFSITLTNIGNLLGWLIQLAISFGTGIVENWSWIEPILMGIVTALIAYNAVQTISNTIQAISASREAVHAASLMLQSGATFAATAAQYGFNAALLACPLTWIVLAIIAVITVMGVVIGIINQVTGSTISLSGVIGGILMSVLAALGNMVIMIWNIVIEVVIAVWNIIADLVNFLANVFTDPLGAIVRLFVGVFDSILSIIESVAGAIGSLFGQDWSSGIQGFRDDMNKAVEEQFGTGVEVVPKLDEKSLSLDYIDYGDAWDAGYQIGEDVEDAISSAFSPETAVDLDGINDSLLEANDLSNQELNLAEGDGVAVKGKVEIDEDTITLLKDVAAVEWVNKYTTLRPELNVTFGDVHETADTEGLLSAMENMIEEAYASALVGEE